MLKSADSPKNGDYVSYIEALVNQSSLSSTQQNKENDIFQDFSDNFSNNEIFSSEIPAKSTPYTLPPSKKTAKTQDTATYTAASFNKNIRRLIFLFFLIVFLGSILADTNGQGAIVLIIIIAIALLRFMASIFTSTKSNRKK